MVWDNPYSPSPYMPLTLAIGFRFVRVPFLFWPIFLKIHSAWHRLEENSRLLIRKIFFNGPKLRKNANSMLNHVFSFDKILITVNQSIYFKRNKRNLFPMRFTISFIFPLKKFSFMLYLLSLWNPLWTHGKLDRMNEW